MTFDGCWDPANADAAAGYVPSLIVARHAPSSPDSYHENLVIKPHGVGNTLHAMIHVMHSEGVEIGSWGVAHQEAFAETKGRPYFESLSDHGRANSVYGNRIVDYDGLAVQYPVVYPDHGEPHNAEGYGPGAQRHVCGNTVDGETHGSPGSGRGDEFPTSETIGHEGGDSPWT